VLAVSGGGVHLHAGDCLKLAKSLGARGVLLKPFSRRQLIQAVNAVMSDCPENK
jgi:CheY-like chemotaxis protein